MSASLIRGQWTKEDNPVLTKSFDEVSQANWGMTAGERVVQLQTEYADAMNKAMGVNSLSGTNDFGDFGALRIEDLDPTMTKVLFDRSHMVMQRWLGKETADQLVYQYNVQHAYGDSRAQAGFREGWGPGTSNAEYSRETAIIRYLGIEGGYTHQLGAMKRGTQKDPVATENENRVIQLLELVERGLVWGDSSLVDEKGEVVMYDGLYKQIRASAPPENVIDMRGQPFELDVLQDIGLIYHDYRYTNDFSKVKMFSPGQVLTDLAKTLDDNDRRLLGGQGSQPAGGYMPGAPIKGFLTQFGPILFQPSVFMQPVPNNKPRLITKGSYGAATTIASATPGVDASGTSQIEAGTVWYFVSAIYQSGESVVSAGVSATPTPLQKVTVTVNRSAQLTDIRGYRIYRSDTANAADAGWVADVPDSAVSITFVDLNDVLPNTNIALVLEGSEDNLMIAQLAPLMRLAQPIFKTTLPFYYILYHTLLVKAPSRQFLIRNIGKR